MEPQRKDKNKWAVYDEDKPHAVLGDLGLDSGTIYKLTNAELKQIKDAKEQLQAPKTGEDSKTKDPSADPDDTSCCLCRSDRSGVSSEIDQDTDDLKIDTWPLEVFSTLSSDYDGTEGERKYPFPNLFRSDKENKQVIDEHLQEDDLLASKSKTVAIYCGKYSMGTPFRDLAHEKNYTYAEETFG